MIVKPIRPSTRRSRVSSTHPSVTRVRRRMMKRRRKSTNVIHVTVRPIINDFTRNVTIKKSATTYARSSVRIQRSAPKEIGTYTERFVQSVPSTVRPKTTAVLSDRYGSTKDHHRDLERKKTKCPTRQCVVRSVIASVLFVIIAAVILLVFLLKIRKPPAINLSIVTPPLRWNTNGLTIVGNSSDPLNYPLGVTIDYANTLYIADTYNNRIQKYLLGAADGVTVAGQRNGTSGSSQAQLFQPARVIADDNGDIFISDTGNNRIQFWGNGASIGMTVAGGAVGTLNNQLDTPYGIAYDFNSRKLYIADYVNARIMSYSSGASSGAIVAGGNGVGQSSSQLYGPFGLYFDSVSSSLHISQLAGNNVIRWVLGASSWSLLAGNNNGLVGNTSTLLNGPGDVTLDPMGNIYIADTNNHRIQVLLAGQSQVFTIAGISGITGSNASMLNSPYSLALDNQLNLYVADTYNQRIQKFTRY